MAAACILAGELDKSGGDHRTAFQRYENIYRPFIERQQNSAERFAAWFAPKTGCGICVRNMTMRLMPVATLSKLLVRRMIPDRLALPDCSVR